MTVEEKLDDLFDEDCPHVASAYADITARNECRKCVAEHIRAAVEEAVKAERERIAQEAEKKATRFFECALANSHVTFAPGECSAVNAVLVTFAAAIRGAK